ncbi:MAG: MFS transporter [Anaerolineae bacterium]|nr:MFS transporter [Anaerolineae bacterium]
MSRKWQTIYWLAIAEFLAMSLWFSASAVTPALSHAWGLNSGGVAWLTMSVQIGFVVGAFLSALFNLADVWPPRFVFAGGAILGAIANGLIPLAVDGLSAAIALRFVTGFALAAVYPVGMKIMATWMKEDRGFGIGLLVGALVVGSASPHLVRAFGGVGDWRVVMFVSSGAALAASLIGWRFGGLGPYRAAPAPFRFQYLLEAFRNQGVRLANFGYFGHMWELYAAWTYLALFLSASFQRSGMANFETNASIMTFFVIGIGGLGSLGAGWLADRWGRNYTTILSMAISGLAAVTIGFFYGGSPVLVSVIALIWGFAIVADSAQFSTAVSELADRSYMGTALTMQTSLGFLLTLVSIRLIPILVDWVGWEYAFTVLALGPLFGIWAMWRLCQSPAAMQLAGGRG